MLVPLNAPGPPDLIGGPGSAAFSVVDLLTRGDLMRRLAVDEQRIDARMPPTVKLRLSAKDFRLHPGTDTGQAHWLVGTIYGRHLLKTKLRQMRPDLRVLMVQDQPEYEQLLESVIDVLELREWAEPKTVSERLKTPFVILRMAYQIGEGREPPKAGLTW